MITIGLLIFALGSVVAAHGEHTVTVILSRELQWEGVFVFCASLLLLWLAVVVTAPRPRLFDSRVLPIADTAPATDLARRLAAVPGVVEAVVVAEQRVAYLKVDKPDLDEEKLRQFAAR